MSPLFVFSSFLSFVVVSQVIYFGGFSVGVPPLPMPNRAVKPAIADGTGPCGRKSRQPPCLFGAPGASRRDARAPFHYIYCHISPSPGSQRGMITATRLRWHRAMPSRNRSWKNGRKENLESRRNIPIFVNNFEKRRNEPTKMLIE